MPPQGGQLQQGDSKSQGVFMGPRGRSLWPQPGEEGGSGVSRALWAVGWRQEFFQVAAVGGDK